MSGAIRPRRVSFDWDATPMHWVPGDPFTTHVINVLHLLLPAGERWFVDVYRQALPLARDERLREDARGFMGQEAVHARAHAAVLEHVSANGLDPSPYTRRIEWMFETLLGDRKWLPRSLQRRWLDQRLAIIAAVEHFTAVLGNWVLVAEGLDRANADPVMLDLLRWHGAEEVEHRSVAFDFYTHVCGSYARRVVAMALVAPILAFLWVSGARFLWRADPALRDRKFSWREWRVAERQGKVPPTRELLAAAPRFLRRDYHPSQEGSTAVAVSYLERSPAARAAVYGAA